MFLNWSKPSLKTIEKRIFLKKKDKGIEAPAGRRFTSGPTAEASLAHARTPFLPPYARARVTAALVLPR